MRRLAPCFEFTKSWRSFRRSRPSKAIAGTCEDRFFSALLLSDWPSIKAGAPTTGREQRLDRVRGQSYVWQTAGDFRVKPIRCILVLLLLATVVCASTVPAVDDPSTAFNESDTPANMALPVVPGVKLVRPATDPVPAPQPLQQVDRNLSFSAYAPGPAPKQERAHSLLKLLCTLLI